ncbi:MAG: hypothetical protein ACLU37_06225 [Collinsella sp.]
MKIDPELLSDLAGLVDRSVVITGTNGKTTTSNLIADAVAASGAAWCATVPATIWSLVWWCSARGPRRP